MAEIELTLSQDLKVLEYGGACRQLLGDPDVGFDFLELLSDDATMEFANAVESLQREKQFATLTLSFRAPGASKTVPADRSPLNTPYASPKRAGFHSGSEEHLSCFVRITKSESTFRLVGMEYSRQHRKKLVKQEFEAWLLNNCINDAITVASNKGEILKWNQKATQLYQYTEQEAFQNNGDILESLNLNWTEEEKVDDNEGDSSCDDDVIYAQSENLPYHASCDDFELQSLSNVVCAPQGAVDDYRLSGPHTRCEEKDDSSCHPTGIVSLAEYENKCKSNGYSSYHGGGTEKSNDTISKIEPQHHRLLKMKRKDQSTFMGRVTDWSIKNERGQVDYRVIVTAEEPQNDGKVESVLGPNGSPIPSYKKAQQRYKDAEQKSQEAEARSAAMVQTMSMLSHDLRSPLQGIMGMTSLALHEFEDHSYDESFSCMHARARALEIRELMYEYITTIHSSSQLLLNFINNMLDIRKIQSGMMEKLELECFDLGGCVDESAEYLAPLTRINDVTLNVRMGRSSRTKLSLVMGTPLRVQQVLVNLIGNAVKYSSHSGDEDKVSKFVDIQVRRSTVQIARREAAGALCSTLDPSSSNSDTSTLDFMNGQRSVLIVDVRDRGDGIPVEEAGNIFAEFKQLQKHTGQSSGFAQPTGSGLGLQLCGSMMASMNGCLWANNCDDPRRSLAASNESLAASSELGAPGCVFSFYLECPSANEARVFLGDEVEEHKIITQLILHNETMAKKKEGVPGSITKRSNHNPMKGRSLLTPLEQAALLAPARLGAIRALVVDDIIINVKVLCRMLNVLGIVHVRSACSPVHALEVSER
jgi:signal transduction histidine kinase/PAS domain-containing protein